MDMALTRTEYRADGILSRLTDMAGTLIAVTLEHSYTDGQGGYYPKVLPGNYICERGIHQLLNEPNSFETFQLMDVPNHTGILFHVGNYNDDSEGCILLGESIGSTTSNQIMIMSSHLAFAKFMSLQGGAESFYLTVLG